MDDGVDWTEFVANDMLTRKVTLDEYFADINRLVEQGIVPRRPQERVVAQLNALAKPGDEWWEWVSGSEPLMQMGGLALVRDGKIVWAMNGWIS